MSRNIRRILIAAGAVVLLALALVIMKYAFPEKEPLPPPETPVPTEQPVHYLIQRSGSEIRQVTVTYPDSDDFVISADAKDDGSYAFDIVPEDDFFGYNTARLRSLMYTLSSLSAMSKIEEAPADLSVYGLDDVRNTVTVDFTDGTGTTLRIGNETPVNGYYYVNTDEDDTVYTLGGYVTGLITRHPFEYRLIDSFPSYMDEEVYTNITHFRLTQRDGTAIDIVLDSDLSMEGNISSSAYMMTSPLVSPCTSDSVEPILDVLATLTYDAILLDITEENLAEYGMDRPARLYLEDYLGNSLEIVIGTTLSNACYAAIGRQYDAFLAGETDYLTILRYTEDNYDWIDLNYMNLQIRTPWIINIHQVESLTYDFGGTVYDMELYEYDDVTGSGIDVVRTCSTINGKDINETNTKRIFSRTLNFRQVGALPEGTAYDPDFAYSIEVRMKDGTVSRMTFHRINDRQFACVLNGAAEYYIYASNIDNLTVAIERAMDDRQVSLVYDR